MKKLLLGVAAAATLAMAAPASAQVYFGADPDGVGVQVGPIGAGVGPRYWDHRHSYRGHAYRGAYAYGDCRVVRSRVVTPNGRVVWRSRQVCR